MDGCVSELNDQLTDGGPSVMLELPDCVAGPPFGSAASRLVESRQERMDLCDDDLITQERAFG
jgi:hypothetical protein